MKHEIEQVKERFIREAEKARVRAEKLPLGPDRDVLLKQADTLAHIDAWLSSPGLRPPT
jgi:hypothetical protein